MKAALRLFTSRDHKGHYVGAASVVVAEDEPAARVLLTAALDAAGLGGDTFTLQEVPLTTPTAVILQNGDY